MQEKMAKDDMGEAWRKKRLEFCRKHLSTSGAQWVNFVQADDHACGRAQK